MDYPRLSDVVDYLLGDVLELSEKASAPQPASVATTRTDEPIAIVAVSCRFPGAPNPEAFWEVLSGGVDAIRRSRRTGSTSTSSTTLIQTVRARPTRASADSSTGSTDSIRNSSASRHAKPSGSSRSSG